MKLPLLNLILTIALLSALVSANGINVYPVEVTGNNPSLNPGETFEIKFKINNGLNQNLSRILIVFSEKLASGLEIGKLKSIKYGNSVYPISQQSFNSQTLPGAILENVRILGNTQSAEFFTLNVETNSSLLPNTYSTSVQLMAKNDSGSNVAISALPVSINILPKPIIRINEIQRLLLNQTGILNISNRGNANIETVVLNATGAPVVFSENNFGLSMGSSRTVEVTLLDATQIAFGNTEIEITAKDANNPAIQSSHRFTLTKSFCKFGPAGANLSISNIDITNEDGEEDEWMPLNNINVEVEVENNGESDLSDVVVELGLFNSAGKNIANKLKFSNRDEEKINLGKINDGDEERAVFSFVIPADLEEGSYKLAIKAYSKRTGENRDCTDRSSDLSNTIYESISVKKEDDEGKFIYFDNVQLSSAVATCGETLTLSTNVYNVANEDQDRVKITLANRELNLDLSQEIINLDSGEGKPITFTFVVPQGVTNKSYNLEMSAAYDYRNGVYREALDEPSKVLLKVLRCPISPQEQSTEIQVTEVSLDSEAVAGSPIRVTAEIKNTGSQQKNLIISAEGFESWAKLQKISEPIVTLNAGATKAVLFDFNVDNSASGKKTFTIKISDGTNILHSEEVEVDVSKKSTSGFAGLNLTNNQILWVLGIINVILIVLIIIAVLRITRH